MEGILVNVSYVGEASEVIIIDVEGYIDTTTAPEVARVISEQIAVRKYCLIVNLEGVDYISNAGWDVFISDLKEIRQNNGDLVLVNMTPNVNNIFELMELSLVLKSFLGVEKAINYLLKVEVEEKEDRSYNQQPVVVNENPGLRAVVSPAGEPAKEQIKETIKDQTKDPAKEQIKETIKDQTKEPAKEQIKETIKDQTKEPLIGFIKEQKVVHISSHIKEAEKERDNVLSNTHTEVGKMILKVILERPYLDVKEIVEALRLPRFGSMRVKKEAVKKELKYMDLLDKAKRFEFAMKSK